MVNDEMVYLTKKEGTMVGNQLVLEVNEETFRRIQKTRETLISQHEIDDGVEEQLYLDDCSLCLILKK